METTGCLSEEEKKLQLNNDKVIRLNAEKHQLEFYNTAFEEEKVQMFKTINACYEERDEIKRNYEKVVL